MQNIFETPACPFLRGGLNKVFVFVDLLYTDLVRNLEKTILLKRQKKDLLVIAEEGDLVERLQRAAQQYRFSSKSFTSAQLYHDEISSYTRPQVIFTSTQKPEEVLALREACPHAYIVLIIKDELEDVHRAELLKAGGSVVMSHQEFFKTAKLEFICLQRIKGSYYPISLQDVFPATEMSFNAFVRMPLNQKFLAVIFRGFRLSEEKYKRIEKEGRLFIRARDTADYLKYILHYNDSLGNGLKKRCRAEFLSLASNLMALQEMIVFDSMKVQPPQLEALFNKVENACREIIKYIESNSEVDLWEVFKDALSNDLFNYWRAPWIAVYAGLICHQSKKGDPLSAMLTGCFADIGMFDIDREVFFEYMQKGPGMSKDNLPVLQTHPILSLNRCMSVELPLGEIVKSAMVSTHERQDLKGYPNQSPPDKIPAEAWAVQLAEMIDFGSRTFMVENNVTFDYLRKTIWKENFQEESCFPPDIIEAYKKGLK